MTLLTQKTVSFAKYQGAGNDFILIDDRSETFPCTDELLISKLCDRHFGIGADGLILLQQSAVASFRMRIFNCDGKEAGMCGNGLRCLIAFIADCTLLQSDLKIEVENTIYPCFYDKERISIQFPLPKLLSEDERGIVIDSGVEHLLIAVDDIEAKHFIEEARRLRSDMGVNVSWVKQLGNSVQIRTFERGVEGETLACGTAALAAAYNFFQKSDLDSVSIIPRSKEHLLFHKLGSAIEMRGPAKKTFSGSISP